MDKKNKIPVFNMLGYNIQSVNYKRIGNELLDEIRINILSKKYDEDTKIYSLVLGLEIDFENSKGNKIELLRGFKINDDKILEEENNIVSIFSASLFPYLRNTLQNLTSDNRVSINIPTIDLRYLDLAHGISLKQDKKQV